METTVKIHYKLPIHEHLLFFATRFYFDRCHGCRSNDGAFFGGYFCNEYGCQVVFHKECAEAAMEVKHHFHPEHPLLLTIDEDSGDSSCALCGQEALCPPFYSCSTCEFKVDLTCGINPSPLAIEHPSSHNHPLVFLKKRDDDKSSCVVCTKFIDGPSYACHECDVYFHIGCVHLTNEVNHPHHFNHPLKLVAYNTVKGVANHYCLICGKPREEMVYFCSICNFVSCLYCTRNPPPIVVENFKTHKHPLLVFSSKFSCTCDVCGLESYTNSYFCYLCDFFIHGKCIDLPRVININCHDHRVSFTHPLGAGFSKCGVCRRDFKSQFYGAYRCSVCPYNYGVHTKCAISRKIWDGIELEGIPEDTEDVAPFKVASDGLINHFSHAKHPLKLYKDNNIFLDDKWLQCEACNYPLGFGSIYACKECCFILHEKCANLPMKKRFVLSTALYTLECFNGDVVDCERCGLLSGGFKYSSKGKMDIDVLCGSLYEPFTHDGHIHPLYFETKPFYSCKTCWLPSGYQFSCDCTFTMCYYCGTLPLKIWHRNHEHPVTLCCRNMWGNVINWCDICEEDIKSIFWFYRCSDCGVTFHVGCVIEDFSRLKVESIFNYCGKKFKVVPNYNWSNRPLCSQCHSRCTKVSVFLKSCDVENGIICSKKCLKSYVGVQTLPLI